MLIDSVNNEMIGVDIKNITAVALKNALSAAEAGDTLTLTGTVPTGTFTVKSGVTLQAAATATINAGTIVNAQPGATVIVAGNREMVGENSLSSDGTITLTVLAGNRMKYTLSDDAVLNGGTLELAGADEVAGHFHVTGANNAKIIVYNSWAQNDSNGEWMINGDSGYLVKNYTYTWNGTNWTADAI